jgi:hypothetical protein
MKTCIIKVRYEGRDHPSGKRLVYKDSSTQIAFIVNQVLDPNIITSKNAIILTIVFFNFWQQS